MTNYFDNENALFVSIGEKLVIYPNILALFQKVCARKDLTFL